MKNMTYQEKKILLALLDLAAEEFSNHGCNDFDMSEILPSLYDRKLVARKMYEDSGDLATYEEDVKLGSAFRYDNDAGLFSYFAAQLLHELSEIKTVMYAQVEKGLQASYNEDIERALFTIAQVLGYEEEKDAFHLEIKPVDPEDELGTFLYRGLQTNLFGNRCYYLDKIREHEGMTVPFEYTQPQLHEDRFETL